MTPVTDPAVLAQLNGGPVPVTDPAILAQLNQPDNYQTEDPDNLTDAAKENLHMLGLGVRGGVNALTGLPNMIANIPAGVANATRWVGDKLLDVDQSSPSVGFSNPFNEGMDTLGVAQPQNAAERIGTDLASSVGGANVLSNTGKEALTTAGGIIGPKLAKFLSANPELMAKSAATGTISGDVAKENDASPGMQLAANLVGGMAPSIPSAAGNFAKYMMRGGDQNLPDIADNIQDFNNSGVTPSLGQATQGTGARYAENMLAKYPGSYGVIHDFAENQQSGLGDFLGNLTDNLSPTASPSEAGKAIQTGLKQSYIPSQKAIENAFYNKVGTYIPDNQEVDITNTQDALKRLNASIPGAENLSNTRLFSNPILSEAQSAIKEDLANGQGTPSTILNVNGRQFTLPAVQGKNTMPYAALSEMRSRIGNKLSTVDLSPDIPVQELKQLYGAISSDMGNAAQNASPDAYDLWRKANNFSSNFHDELDTLKGVINADSPEAAYRSAMSETPIGGSKIGLVMQSLPSSAQEKVAAQAMNEMGKATAGQQNAAGDAFSNNTFLTRWNKLSPEAKTALFNQDTIGNDTAGKLNSLANVTSNLREGSKVLANPSGTSSGMASGSAGTALIGSILTGHPGIAATTAGTIGITNLLAKALTNPNIVNRLATPMNSINPALLGTAISTNNR